MEQNGRLKEQFEVIRFCRDREIPAVVVGRWVWVYFSDKPSAEVRDGLKTAGFRWIHKRSGWAHNCGYYSKQGIGDPRFKYGAVPVQAFTDAELEGVA